MSKRSLIRSVGARGPVRSAAAAADRGGGASNDASSPAWPAGSPPPRTHDVTVGDLHLTMPMSLREEGDEIGGNRITIMRFDVPAGVAIRWSGFARCTSEPAGCVTRSRCRTRSGSPCLI